MILVTGATGLVGSHLLLHLLENEERVCAIYRNKNSILKTKHVFELYQKEHLFDNINWVEADINDVPSLEIAFQNIEYVYHCAALISFDPKDEEKLRKINIEGTANIVNFCLAKNIKKLCYVSSIAALGNLAENENLITEETEWNPEKPHSDYAISKYGAEMEVWRAQQEGLQVVIVNPGVILGPGFWEQSSGEIFSKVKNGLLFYSTGTTGFVSVYDVVKIMSELMKSTIHSERFTVIAGNYSFKEVLFSIANVFKVNRPSINAKKWMTNLAYKINWISSTFFFQKRKISKDMASSLHKKDLISNEKIKAQLNYQFEDVFVVIQKIIALQTKKTI